MKVLSLFDGMACGSLALQSAGIEIESYDAFEIDKYAIQTSTHNFPFIKHHGDVFSADFAEFEGVDLVCGGSPCTYWSIAQKNNRETEASGMGWELFSQYVRAVKEAKPKFFVYENNKSMSKEIRASIDKTFGFEAVLINSALVSAQNRQRLYWVGRRNSDGTYSKVDIEQPADRGILLKDILENGIVEKEKSYCLKHQAGNARDYFKKHHTQIKFEPVCVASRGRYQNGNRTVKVNGGTEQYFEARHDSKTNAITTVQKDNMVAEPVAVRCRGRKDEYGNGYAKYEARNDSKSNTLDTNTVNGSMVAEPIRVGCLPSPDGSLKNSQGMRIYSDNGKSVNITASGGGMGGKTGLYAIPVDFAVGFAIATEFNENGEPVTAISSADNKKYKVYKVENGLITIKDKQYPIKLADGYYIIRKLTVRECARLQTVPEWYEFPVSNTQTYKLLGNGWTVEVIAHILQHLQQEN